MTSEYLYTTDGSCSQFQFYEQHSGAGHNRRCIDGTNTGCNKCVGYCSYEGHPGFLTEKHRREHQCLEKKCFYYVKKVKQNRKDARHFCPIQKDDVFKEAVRLTAEMEGLRVLAVNMIGEDKFEVRYITISNCYEIQDISDKLTASFGICVTMKQIVCDFERAVEFLVK